MDGLIDLKSLSQSSFSDGEGHATHPERESTPDSPLPQADDSPAPAPQENSIGPASASTPKVGENWLEELMDYHGSRPSIPAPAAKPQLRKKPDLRVVPNTPEEPAPTADEKSPEVPAAGSPQPARKLVSEADIPAPDVRQAQQILAKYRVTEHKDTRLFIPAGQSSEKVAFAVFKDAIKSSAEDSDTACGMVAAAVANGWNPIRASGTPAFQSQIFLHACRLGVVIENFTPTPDDLAALRKEQIPLPAWASLQNQVEPARVKRPSTELGL